jgi:agmatinase
MLCEGHHPHFNCALQGLLGDAGDLALPNTGLPVLRAALEPLVPPLIAQHRMAWLGGDHSITLSLLRAYRAQAGRPLALVHVDAHCDTWVDHFGEPSGHGTWVYEAFQEGLVAPAAVTQIGLRSPGLPEARDYVRQQGGQIHTARDLRGLHTPQQWQPVVDGVAQRWQAAGRPPL